MSAVAFNLGRGDAIATVAVFPIIVGAVYLGRKIQGDSHFGLPFDETKWPVITERVRSLEKVMNLGKKVEIFEKRDVCYSGTDIFSGRAHISLDPQALMKFSQEEQDFAIAHELGHIKNKDSVKGKVVALAATLIPIVALPVLFPGLLAASAWTSIPLYFGAAWLSRCSVNSIWSHWREKCADKQAFSVCTEKGGISFFTKVGRDPEQIILDGKLGRCTRFFFNELGHPSLQTRINYLKSWAREKEAAH